MEDLQQSLYLAAKADDRATVNTLLKRLILTPERSEEDKRAFSLTIDIATKNMATLSLLVLSLQGNATGLFRHLAEAKPDDIRRMAPALVAETQALDFVRPLVEMGVDKSFTHGKIFARAVETRNMEMIEFIMAGETGAEKFLKPLPESQRQAAQQAYDDMLNERAARESLSRLKEHRKILKPPVL